MWSHVGHEVRKGPSVDPYARWWPFACLTCYSWGVGPYFKVQGAPDWSEEDYERWVEHDQ